MRRCLLLCSLLLMVAAGMSAVEPQTTVSGDYLLALSGRQQYSVTIDARGAEITGVCIVKTNSEGTRGAIVNEFGIHALDFTLSPDRHKVRLENVMPMMDRWFIRRILRKDLRLLFGATTTGGLKSGRSITVSDDGTIVLNNARYKLNYSLKKIDDTTE